MKFLLDTNVLIAAEPTLPEHLEGGAAVASELLGAIAAGGHQALVHTSSLEELRGDLDPARSAMRDVLLLKYPRLPNPPSVSQDLESLIGAASPGSHDAIDHALLEAMRANAVDYLVTEDQRLLRKAAIAGLGDRVVTPADALATLRALFPITPAAPPAVRPVFAHQLRDSDAIFESLRAGYPDFDAWLIRCKREQRRGWLIEATDGRYAGVCLVKDNENPGAHGLRGRLVKLSTFKVSERHRGFRNGELLLKTALSYASANRYDTIFVTVFPKHVETIVLLEEFGFRKQDARTNLGEFVLAKALTFSPRGVRNASPTRIPDPLWTIETQGRRDDRLRRPHPAALPQFALSGGRSAAVVPERAIPLREQHSESLSLPRADSQSACWLTPALLSVAGSARRQLHRSRGVLPAIERCVTGCTLRWKANGLLID